MGSYAFWYTFVKYSSITLVIIGMIAYLYFVYVFLKYFIIIIAIGWLWFYANKTKE